MRGKRDTSAARRARTIEAPNGARVVMPLGTTDSQLLDQLLKWYYGRPLEAFSKIFWPVDTPLWCKTALPRTKPDAFEGMLYTGMTLTFSVRP